MIMDYDELRSRGTRPEYQRAMQEREQRAIEAGPEVQAALSELYGTYYRHDNDPARYRMDVEQALAQLMTVYNVWLG